MKKNNKLKKYLLLESTTIGNCIKLLDKTLEKFSLIVNRKKQILGSVTDGDLRRGILRGFKLDEQVTKIMNKNVIFINQKTSKSELMKIMKVNKIKQLPLVNKQKVIKEIYFFNELNSSNLPNHVIIMSGGRGERLLPLTLEKPKPLLELGKKPILQYIIERFQKFGLHQFIISINYKASEIKKAFKDYNNIRFIEEKRPLGTAGSIGLIKKLNHDFIVINGDIITNLNISELFEFHEKHKCDITICSKILKNQLRYGVIKVNKKNELEKIEEKPIQDNVVNAGIYLCKPKVIDLIPKNKFFNMTDLLHKALDKKFKCKVYLIEEFWMDIGTPSDYEYMQRKIKFYDI